MEREFAVIILAAGQSARLGRPKQSLRYGEDTLLSYAVKTAIATDCGPVLVVLGSEADRFKPACEGAHVIINSRWQQGMASSICCGVEGLCDQFPAVKGTILSVCDQPHVNPPILRQLILQHRQTRLPIIASNYGQITGTPAFFHVSIFPELLRLKGDQGAKSVLLKDPARVGMISFPAGNEDIDTEEDYSRLLGKEKRGFI